MKSKKEFWGKSFFCFLLVVVISNIFAYFYVTKSRFIYSWDNTLFWSAARSLSEYKVDLSYFKMMYASFGNSEYNMLPTVLPSLVMKIFGTSRLTFIISIINLYFVPTAGLIFIISRKHFKHSGIAAIFIILSLPIMLFIGLVGFLDLGAVFFALFAVWLYLDFKEREIIKSAAIGILLVISMLFRRYFAFFVLSFITAAWGEAILYRKKKAGVVLMSLTVGTLLIFCFRDFFLNQLLKNYGTLYSGYKFNLMTDFKLISRYFGIIPLLIIAVMSVKKFLEDGGSEFVFLWIKILLCFFMFTSTQTHGQQHLLLYVPGLLMLIFYAVPQEKSIYFKAMCKILPVCIFANTLVLHAQPESLLEIKHFALIPDFSMRARIRDDADEILSLKKYLNGIVEKDKKVGVLASGLGFNEDILRNCEASLGEKETREDFFLNLPCVDSRDKDLSAFFEVDYMVVAYPVQTHLGEERQQITVKAVECFLKNEGIANAFLKFGKEFKISDISVFVYKKIRPVTKAEKDEFCALFK